MKGPSASAILSVAALSSCTFAAVSMNIVKDRDATPKLRRRDLSPRATIIESLANNETGGDYIAVAKVGTPAQTVTFLIDTGSSDVWMLAASADLCNEPSLQAQFGGCSSTFDQTKSSTYKLVDEGAFQITYGDNTGANGDYITDTMSIGGATVTALEMGLAYNASSATGVMGIGYDINEASDDSQGEVNPFVYPSIIDTMVSQGLINTKAYSLYLDDLEASTGSIIFGGYDTDKYHGTLYQLPIVQEAAQNGSNLYVEFGVVQTGFSITNQSGTTTTITNSSYSTPAILDSGTALAYLPGDLTADIVSALNGLDDTANSGNIYVDCNLLKDTSMTFNFGFGGSSGSSGITIKVPVSELVFKLNGMFAVDPDSLPKLPYTACALGIQSGAPGPYILGDVFLRSAYVVYDLKNNVIGIAQTNFGSTTSNVIEFQSSATSIPTQTGVATGAVVDPTGTKNAGVSSVPGFDMRRLVVLGFSAGFAVLGGLLIV